MRTPHRRSVECAALCAVLLVVAQPGAAQSPAVPASVEASGPALPQGPLRLFELTRPAGLQPFAGGPPETSLPTLHQPRAKDSLRTIVGLGYVQGADWGSEILASGAVSGAQVQLNALVTKGQSGFVFDHGSVSVFDPDTQWRVEAGDLFSPVRGVSTGGRFSWNARGNRRPSVAFYGRPRGLTARGTAFAYRDQIQIGEQTILDAEVATDGSSMLRSRFEVRGIELEIFNRAQRVPRSTRDVSVTAAAPVWRGVYVSAGVFRSFDAGTRSDWNTVALRLPLARFMDITLERAFAGTDASAHTTSAVMASLTAGNLRLFHRHQYGEYDLLQGGAGRTMERIQTQSMSSYAMGKRASLTLQLATQRADNGRMRHWEELHTTVKVTPTTTVRAVTSVPDFGNRDRFQTYVRQELPAGLALQADYGRISSFQPIARGLDRSRLKVMLFKSFSVTTPARGASVEGRVVDPQGRGIAGVRVRLGPYGADSDAGGRYSFRHVPRGDYELSLASELLPADIAWDGRAEQVTAPATGTVRADLRITPLNAIHGRVYIDGNANNRYDAGEAVAGVVLQLGDRLTSTDRRGAYAFYNVWPGMHQIRVHATPATVQPSAVSTLAVTLDDGRPVTGADFQVVPRIRPIVWELESR